MTEEVVVSEDGHAGQLPHGVAVTRPVVPPHAQLGQGGQAGGQVPHRVVRQQVGVQGQHLQNISLSPELFD